MLPMHALDALRARLAELTDLEAITRLAFWDQRTTMPSAGGAERAGQLATLERVSHQLATGDVLGRWLDQLEAEAGTLGEIDRDIVRIARRDYDRRRRVPAKLAGELAQAGAEGQDAWQIARANDDFAAFAPVLERNLALAREYAACVGEPGQTAYDALLGDYDFGLTAAAIERVFGALGDALPPLAAEAAERSRHIELDVPLPAQQAAVQGVLTAAGVDEVAWRLDVSAHPFTAWVGRNDIRLTTRYQDGRLESVLAAAHEFGHGLYEHQIPEPLSRTNLGHGTSMSVHESQSKLWENHVGRHPAFATVIAAALGEGGFAIAAEDLHAALVAVEPSLIRVSADPVTYPLHIVLRFELEHALIAGDLAVADLPAAWRDAMRRLRGVEVPDDASGVLQDVHWAAGAFGYFPSYALGCLLAAQLWETLEADLGDQSDALRAGDTAAIRAWLAERVHAHGRRLDTEPLVRAATGRGLEVEPFVRHVRALHG